MLLYNSIWYWISFEKLIALNSLQYETIFKLNSPSAISSDFPFFLFLVHERKEICVNKQQKMTLFSRRYGTWSNPDEEHFTLGSVNKKIEQFLPPDRLSTYFQRAPRNATTQLKLFRRKAARWIMKMCFPLSLSNFPLSFLLTNTVGWCYAYSYVKMFFERKSFKALQERHKFKDLILLWHSRKHRSFMRKK